MSSQNKKSLTLAFLVVFVNWFAYFTFRLIGYQELIFSESLYYAIYVSILDFIVVYFISRLILKYWK